VCDLLPCPVTSHVLPLPHLGGTALQALPVPVSGTAMGKAHQQAHWLQKSCILSAGTNSDTVLASEQSILIGTHSVDSKA
jgi:hypothetical protein